MGHVREAQHDPEQFGAATRLANYDRRWVKGPLLILFPPVVLI